MPGFRQKSRLSGTAEKAALFCRGIMPQGRRGQPVQLHHLGQTPFKDHCYAASPLRIPLCRENQPVFPAKLPFKRKRGSMSPLIPLKEGAKGHASLFCFAVRRCLNLPGSKARALSYFFIASSTATATATVAPTMGLLPMPRKPIISTCAGTEEEPANCASECIRPMVSVIP